MKISASIQAANQLDLLNHIDSNNTKFDQLHIDITDGHFAENISMSFKVIEMLKNNTRLFRRYTPGRGRGRGYGGPDRSLHVVGCLRGHHPGLYR